MGKPIDKNKPTKNFDELLEHLKKPVDDLDAFEQEALEGFATLESSQEAIELKKRLDERMEEKLSEKRRPLFIYWSAAAGVALILSLVFLLRTNSDLKSEEALADNTVNSEQLPGNSVNDPATPAELKQTELSEKATGSKSGKAFAEGESNERTGGLNKGPVQPIREESASKTSDAEMAMADEVSDLDSRDQSKGDKDANAQKRADSKPVDDLAASSTKNQNNVPANAAAGSSSDASNEKSKAKEEEDYKDSKATEYFSRKIKKEKKAAQTTPAETKSEIEGTFENSTIKAASLTITEQELQQKIDKFFKDKDYKKPFVCTVTVDSENIVESVVFQNPDLFSKSQRKELTAFLLKLKCFKNHEYSVYSTYQIKYKAQ